MVEDKIGDGVRLFVVNTFLIVIIIAEQISGSVKKDIPDQRQDGTEPIDIAAFPDKESDCGYYGHRGNGERPEASCAKPFFYSMFHYSIIFFTVTSVIFVASNLLYNFVYEQ